MKLCDVCEALEALSFPALGERDHPDKATVLAARAHIGAAVVDDEFLADCIANELRLVESNRPRRGLVPFFTLPHMGLRFAFGYWPPGGTPGPHEHTAWTITAVCRNELEVLTYDRDESYRRRELVTKHRFHAPAGKVGFIYDPCIHEPRNTTHDWSLSLHVISPRDGEPLSDQREPIRGLCFPAAFVAAEDDHPFSQVLVARQRDVCVLQLARILATMDVPPARDVLARCFAVGSTGTRRHIARIAPHAIPADAVRSPWRLVRSHEQLVLRTRVDDRTVSLDVDTPGGPIEQLAVSALATDAISFAAREPQFSIDALPGDLSAEERMAIGEALEETGLFRRLQQ